MLEFWGTGAAIVVALAAVLGLLVQFFKREKPWTKGQTELKLRVTKLESESENLIRQIDDVKSIIEDHDRRDEKDFERLETKIEKLTDLMIRMISDDNSTRSTVSKDKK